MEQLRNYFFSIIISAIICSLIQNILSNSISKSIGRFICGVVVCLSILSPGIKWSGIKIDDYLAPYLEEAEEVAAMGQEISKQTRLDIIKLKAETYILEKAAELGSDISVFVSIAENGDPVPVSVDISGNISPYVKGRLENILEDELGIAKENQRWFG